MMKGYLTVFMSLSLSILAGFILLLTKFAIGNGGKVRLECAADTAMNAVLSEYHMGLFERYGLLYVDASYLKKEPSISNVEERLLFYLKENTEILGREKDAPWGIPGMVSTEINAFETAAAGNGASMRHQAVLYSEDRGSACEENKALEYREEIAMLSTKNPMEEWSGIMEQLAEMELPMEMDEKGVWQEVPLSNPADWVYGLAGSDVLYLANQREETVHSAQISLDVYISHRGADNTGSRNRAYQENEEAFLAYLFEKMGCLGNPVEGAMLSCQLEYLAKGEGSDLKNVRAVAEELLRWRFADNVTLALSDGGLREAARAKALALHAVQLKEALQEPVTESILYACAFQESIADLRVIYSGGCIPVKKSTHSMSVEHMKNGTLYTAGDGGGLTYRQYLACLLLLESKEQINLRAMDIMEMDIRKLSGNQFFAMDWCIESYEACIQARGSYGGNYFIRRKYGFF